MQMVEKSIEHRICDFVSSLTLENVPEEVITCARRSFADTIGAIVAGSMQEQVKIVSDALSINLSAKASEDFPLIIGFGHRNSSIPDAVLLNAVAAYSMEYNDLFYKLPGHPSAVIIPVLLGLGGSLHATGRQIMESYIAGFEVTSCINQSLMPTHHTKGFHSTSTAGIIGSAVAAAKLLNLDSPKLLHALSIACTFACGLRRNFGTYTNSLHVGNAAANGLRAALFASAGITAEPKLLTEPDGYINAFCGDIKKLDAYSADLGKVWAFLTPGLLIKKYPACFSTYQAIDAALDITREHNFNIHDVLKVDCLVPELSLMSLPMLWPYDAYSQRFCVPYCVAAALCYRKMDDSCFGEQLLHDPLILFLKDRIYYGVHPEIAGAGGYGFSEVKVILRDNKSFGAREAPNSEERVEKWSEEQLQRKFYSCCEERLGINKCRNIYVLATRPEPIRDINELLNMLY